MTLKRNEQPLFAPGDKGVCVNSKNTDPELVEGKTYVIESIFRTECCGVIGLTLTGVVKRKNYSGYTCACGRDVYGTFPCFYNQNRFAPIDAIENIEEQIFEALKGIPETL